jgi:hypothetical protein
MQEAMNMLLTRSLWIGRTKRTENLGIHFEEQPFAGKDCMIQLKFNHV